MILHAVGEPAIPVLCNLAVGAYDWYQGMAVKVLCELAADGIQTERVARIVIQQMRCWRYETVLRGIYGMAHLAACNEQVAQALLDLAQQWDSIEELHILEPLCQFAPKVARQRQDQLYLLMRKTGRGLPRCAAAEGFVTNEAGEISEPQGEDGGLTQDYHAIRAALALPRLHPEDQEVRANLMGWAGEHPKRIVRAQLAEVCRDW